MSNRREQYGSSAPSPVVRYYEWKSDDKSFGYYDKVSGENKRVFPLKFAVLTTRSCVRGWHDKTTSSIWSNEVKNTKQEQLSVYSSKPDAKGNTLIAQGFYQDIKGNLEGGHFEKSIYAYEQGVGIVKINLKGSGLAPYSSFEKEQGKKIFDHFVEVSSFETGKKGKITYTTPNFVLSDKIEGELDELINEAYGKVDNYFKERSASKDQDQSEDIEEYEPEVVEEGDGLPF